MPSQIPPVTTTSPHQMQHAQAAAADPVPPARPPDAFDIVAHSSVRTRPSTAPSAQLQTLQLQLNAVHQPKRINWFSSKILRKKPPPLDSVAMVRQLDLSIQSFDKQLDVYHREAAALKQEATARYNASDKVGCRNKLAEMKGTTDAIQHKQRERQWCYDMRQKLTIKESQAQMSDMMQKAMAHIERVTENANVLEDADTYKDMMENFAKEDGDIHNTMGTSDETLDALFERLEAEQNEEMEALGSDPLWNEPTGNAEQSASHGPYETMELLQ